MLYPNSNMSHIKPWVMELTLEIITYFVVHQITMWIPNLFLTCVDNEQKNLTDWIKTICHFLLKKTVIYMLRYLASVLHDVMVRKFFLNIRCYFNNNEMFSKPTEVIVI